MAAPVEKGQILAGKYRVERVLGEGGMGVVVAATDTQLERKVAIKFLLPEYAEHGEAGARFMREARAAVKIQSEHIARVIDVNKMENGSPYMVMEYLEGGDLSQIIEKRGPVPVADAVTYVIQACDAIAEAHSYGIVHRDLKPANLFLAKQPDGSSKVKVLDFGISKNTIAAADGTDPSLTRTSSMMGSPLYMSPEQMRSTKDVDARTDIWALGVILYELLTARLPFDASSIPELSAKILLEDPDPIQREDVPKALENIIQRTLSKNPSGRFPSVAEFSMAIAPYAGKRTRGNIERISRILSAAGMSESQFSMPPTMPPASPEELDVTRIGDETTGGAHSARAHSGTVGQWGRTNGPDTDEKKSSGAGVWIGVAAAAIALVGGGAFFVMSPAGEPAAAAPLTPTPANTGEATEAIEPGPKVEPVRPDPAQAQNVASSDDNDDAKQDTPEETPVEPTTEATAPPSKVPVVSKPKPVIAAPRPSPKAVATPAPKPAPRNSPKKSSLKDKFGSRK